MYILLTCYVNVMYIVVMRVVISCTMLCLRGEDFKKVLGKDFTAKTSIEIVSVIL